MIRVALARQQVEAARRGPRPRFGVELDLLDAEVALALSRPAPAESLNDLSPRPIRSYRIADLVVDAARLGERAGLEVLSAEPFTSLVPPQAGSASPLAPSSRHRRRRRGTAARGRGTSARRCT